LKYLIRAPFSPPSPPNVSHILLSLASTGADHLIELGDSQSCCGIPHVGGKSWQWRRVAPLGVTRMGPAHEWFVRRVIWVHIGNEPAWNGTIQMN